MKKRIEMPHNRHKLWVKTTRSSYFFISHNANERG
jgi:hypothetical protein